MKPSDLPDELLVLIGAIAADWAVIEQEILLHTVHMKRSGGDPGTDWRAGSFKAVRTMWLSTGREHLPADIVAEFEDLYDRICRRFDARGMALHGNWQQTGATSFEVTWWALKEKELIRSSSHTELSEIREQADFTRQIRDRLVAFLRANHR
ncbi:hypothetical protein [Maricaulis sp.]|uniref:hypothetical protein n=1 Tax=Maricaulis sp. TaxID=1486257 RepID=UPI003A8E509E